MLRQMADFLVFRCPQGVQTQMERQQRREGRSFAPFACAASARLDFIHLVSGRPSHTRWQRP
jgi:hypothetical protein